MIKSITIKNVASYCEIGVPIENLQKINFIYGANGCGKTTISNFLLEQENPIYLNSNIDWKDELAVDLVVYNKKFREENFGKGDINGVFTLGKATVEQIEEINSKRDYLKDRKVFGAERRKSQTKLKQEKDSLDNQFKEDCWKLGYKKHEKILKEAFRGHIGDKESFKNKLLFEFRTNQSDLLVLEDINKKAESIFNKVPSSMSLLLEVSAETITAIERNTIWKLKIVGKSDVKISKLINHLNISDWVNEGRHYIKENDYTCPFCQNPTIDDIFRSELERFFDISYTTDIETLKNLADQYRSNVETIINRLNAIEDSHNKSDGTKLNLELFSSILKTIISKFQANLEKVQSKLKEPSRSIEIISFSNEFTEINHVIQQANLLIEENNSLVINYNSERNTLISESWRFICNELNVGILSYIGKEKGLVNGIQKITGDLDALLKEYKKVEEEIITLGKHITSVQPTIDQINHVLKSYGFLSFQIVPSQENENQYQIIRENGTLAESTLSEGEITFITFLYYLHLAKGGTSEEKVSTERILVIDDPISSLDSNVLYVVSSLIKEIIKDIKLDKTNIKQLILLTHNVYFHKEVSFVDGRQNGSNSVNYFILRKKNNVTKVQSYGKENPIHSSYELLWKELKNSEHNSGITIQNTMRRIIENYFKILGKYGDDFLISKFINSDEREICRSLICWINDGSHTIPDDLFIEHQDSVIDKYFEVFRNIFIYSNHSEHYNMMMGTAELEKEVIKVA